MRACYLFASGPLSIAVVAFRNSLVYHKIDFLTSLAIHSMPLIIAFHIRWNTIPSQSSLPDAERRFCLITAFYEQSWGDYLHTMVVNPIKLYFVWFFPYAFINFAFSDSDAKKSNYDSLYKYFKRGAWARKMMDKYGPKLLPVIFLGSHFTYFLITLVYAIC